MTASHLSRACAYAMASARPVPFIGMTGPTPISRRPYSWSVELPSRHGYLSCGPTLAQAMSHALYGSGAAENAAFDALAGRAA